MKSLKLGLCLGRHEIKEVDGYIFENQINPTDLEGLEKICHEKLYKCKDLHLYVTGLTVALVTVMNYCSLHHIPLCLYHFDRDKNEYYKQQVLNVLTQLVVLNRAGMDRDGDQHYEERR